MKLKGIEKQFWWHFGQIKDSKDIPTEVSGISGVDDPEYNDDYFAMLTDKVRIMNSIYLKETYITDEGVKHISKLQGLKDLTLMKHPKITKASLPYLNKLVDLEYLDIWDTGIILEDLVALDQLKSLKELYVSSAIKADDGSFSDLDNERILEHLIVLEDIFPNCTFFVDFKKYL
ncbi:hypothetical protein [Flavobacterium pectinovorum]|uniref:hypothetical protein n=1 Tax=Flavobacterium pectinovorum TaxID=29533 RepID=UPI001FAC3730|nr:hypothetical protein [Flavobacterium pectinovorum]MCI9843368.1 hypothetical protein [Flavobacterium pectinovorum]